MGSAYAAQGVTLWPDIHFLVLLSEPLRRAGPGVWGPFRSRGRGFTRGVEYAEMARACGLKGVKVQSVEQLEQAGQPWREGGLKGEGQTWQGIPSVFV